MLITLREQEYRPVLDEWVGHSDFASFVSILGETLLRGDHVLDATPRLLMRLSEWDHLSGNQRTALETAARSVIKRPVAVEEVTDSLVITGPAGRTSDPVDPARPIRWYRRDWTWLRRRGRLERTVLGGENLDDARWFEWLGRAWAARLRSQSPTTAHEHGSPLGANDLRLRCRGLGGGTAWQEVPHEAAEGDPVLCVLDSDRDHPLAKPGGTARKLDEALRAEPNVERILHVEHLQARDVENILPLELLRLAGQGNHWLAPMEKRGFFARHSVDPKLAYIDLGKVWCEGQLLDTSDAATKRYREACLSRIREHDEECTASASTCERLAKGDPACSRKDKDSPPPSCILVHSIGKPLRRILEAIEQERREPDTSRRHSSTAAWIASMLPADDPSVLTPARLVWSWGLCSRPRIRSAPPASS